MANQPKIPSYKDEDDSEEKKSSVASHVSAIVESFPGVKVGGEKRVLGIAEQMELEEREEARLKMENRLKAQVRDEDKEESKKPDTAPTGQVKPREDYEYKNLWM